MEHAPLLDLAAVQHGLINRDQLLGLGISASSRRRLITSGAWKPVTKRVLRRSGAPITAEQKALAAVFDVGPGSALSHASAAALWGLPGFQLLPAVVTRVMNRSSQRLAIVHSVRVLPPRWVTVLDGIPVVRPELCILHLCATTHRGRAERSLDTAWSMRLLCGGSLIELLVDLGERGRNGVALLRELVDARGPDYVPPASNLEGRFQRVLQQAGLPEMRRQVDSGATQWTGRVDFRSFDLPVIVEVQSERHHSALVDVESDARRLEQLRLDGFEVVEVTEIDVWQHPALVADRVRDALRKARPSPLSSVW